MSKYFYEPHFVCHCQQCERIKNGYFAIREYVDVMSTEPAESLIPLKRVYHDLRRMLGDEE